MADDQEDVVFQFVATGEEDVARAFESSSQAAEKAAKGTEASFARVARSQQQVARTAVLLRDANGRFVGKVAGDAESATKKMADSIEKAARAGFRKTALAAKQTADDVVSVMSGAAKKIAKELGGGFLFNGFKANLDSAVSFAIDKIGGAIRDSMQLQSLANRISIDARKGGERFVDPNQIRKELEKAAVENPGVRATEVGKSVSEFSQRTGNLAAGLDFAGIFATTKSAVGDKVSSEEIGKAGSLLAKRFDITSVEDMGNAMAKLVFAAKDSGQPLSEMVGKFDRLASAAKANKLGSGMEGVNRVLALNALTRQAGVNERQAPMAVANLLQTLTQKNSKIASGLGIDTKKFGEMPVEQKIASIFTGTKYSGKPQDTAKAHEAIAKLLGARPTQAVSGLFDVYAKTYSGAQGGSKEKAKSAEEAVIAAFNAAAKASGDYAELQKDAAQAQSEPAAQLIGLYEQLSASAGVELMPALKELSKTIKGGGFKGAFELLGKIVAGLSVAMEALLARLRESGVLSGGSAQERADAAKKEDQDLAKEQKEMLKGRKESDLSTDEKNRFNSLQADRFNAQERQAQATQEAKDQEDALARVKGASSKDEAMQAAREGYKKLGGSSFLDLNSFGAAGDVIGGITGETAAQRSVRKAADQWVAPGPTSAGGGGAGPADHSETNRQIAELGRTAAQAKQALDDLAKTNRPSIVGDHQ